MTSARFVPLCLDLGFKTGWAWWDAALGDDKSGLWRLDAGGNLFEERIDYFTRRLTLAIQDIKPTVVAFEEIWSSPKNQNQTQTVTHGLMAFTRVIAYRVGIECRIVSPTHLKMTACGFSAKKRRDGKVKGATKQEVMAALNRRRGSMRGDPILQDDQADAVAILYMLAAEQDYGGKLPKSVMRGLHLLPPPCCDAAQDFAEIA